MKFTFTPSSPLSLELGHLKNEDTKDSFFHVLEIGFFLHANFEVQIKDLKFPSTTHIYVMQFFLYSPKSSKNE